MDKVKLKVNMIFGGSFHRFGTVLDREEVPPNLRKSSYLADPEEPEAGMSGEEEIELEEFYDGIDEVEPEPEPPPPPPPKKKFNKFRKR